MSQEPSLQYLRRYTWKLRYWLYVTRVRYALWAMSTGFGVRVAGDSPGAFMVPSQSIGVDGGASG